MTERFLVTAQQLVTVSAGTQGKGDLPYRGAQQNALAVIENGAMVIEGQTILAVGHLSQIKKDYGDCPVHEFPNACITPGLIDCHTHLVFAGTREQDFYERIQGVSYEAIAKRGGGILDSVRHLRAASKETLQSESLKRLKTFLRQGVTTCEIKSGYGLSLEDELKTLEVIQALSSLQPIDLIATFLGAHEFPEEFRGSEAKRQAFIKLIIDEIMPQVAERKLAKFCDVFCEKGVFSVEESEHILKKAKALGFSLKLHVDELAEDFGGAQLAARLKAISADHLVQVSDEGIEALEASGTVAVLLPATTFFLNKDFYAPARKMIDAGVAVAIATDLNPGSSNCESLQAVMTLAALKLKMSPEEIMTAVTHNAACALGVQHEVGRLEPGLRADFLVWDLPDYRQIPYHFGGNHVAKVYKNGNVV